MKSLKRLFAGLSAYVFLYGLACTLILLYTPSEVIRTLSLVLITCIVLFRAVWMLNSHANELEAWGKKHIH